MENEEIFYFEDIELGSSRTSGEMFLAEEDVIRFAREWDPQPFHVDVEAARRSQFGGLTACGVHVFCIASRLTHDFKPLALIAGLKQEVEFPNPARPGDRLKLTGRCVGKRPSESKPDRGILTFESEVTNQNGVLVLRMTSTLLVRRRAGGGGG